MKRLKDLLKHLTILAITMVLVMSGLIFQDNAQALNGPGNKAGNFLGYAYVDSHNIKVFTDKGNANPLPGQVKIFEGVGPDGNQVAIESTIDDGKLNFITGISDLGSSGSIEATSTIIRTKDAFQPGNIYTVLVSSTVKGNNGITIGNYFFNQNSQFSFEVPDSDGNYHAPVTITSRPENGTNMVPWEGNIAFTVNQAVYNHEEVRSGLVIRKNGDVLASGTEMYSPVVNYGHNSFFFPMNGSGAATSYNLSPDADYSLTIPPIKDASGSELLAEQTIAFHTTGIDLPPGPKSAPRLTLNSESLSFEWDSLTDASNFNISGYNLYASRDPYWSLVKINAEPITGNAYTTTFAAAGLDAANSYYFRYTAVNAGGETGFSPYVSSDANLPTWGEQSAVTVSNISKDSLTLSWPAATDNSGAISSYQIYLNGTLLDNVTGNILTYNVTGLNKNTQYNFKIEAGDAAENWTSNGPSITALTALPLVWDPATDNIAVTKYKLYQDNQVLVELDGNTTSYTVGGLTSGISYNFKVEAGDAAGNWSSNGPTLTVSTAAPDPGSAVPPSASPDGGAVVNGTLVILTTSTQDAIIYYTLDGSNPSVDTSTTYTGPITINEPLTVKAIAVKPGLSNSGVMTAAYTIKTDPGNSVIGVYTVTPADHPSYTNAKTADGIDILTVNSGFSGNQDFTVTVSPVIAHQGSEKAVFVQIRNDVQLNLNTAAADFDTVNTASVSFDVQPGDIVKVYIVDDLYTTTGNIATVLEQ
jgi:chitodextrinase